MEYTVPQEFNQEDRIGSFTMVQAGILGAGVITSMLMLTSGLPIIIALILDVGVGFLTVYLMYKKKYNIPIYEFALVYLLYKATPTLLVFRKENVAEEHLEDVFILIDENKEKGGN